MGPCQQNASYPKQRKVHFYPIWASWGKSKIVLVVSTPFTFSW